MQTLTGKQYQLMGITPNGKTYYASDTKEDADNAVRDIVQVSIDEYPAGGNPALQFLHILITRDLIPEYKPPDDLNVNSKFLNRYIFANPIVYRAGGSTPLRTTAARADAQPELDASSYDFSLDAQAELDESYDSDLDAQPEADASSESGALSDADKWDSESSFYDSEEDSDADFMTDADRIIMEAEKILQELS
ncbi:Hypothetical Protein FCC1311_085962 [Hondaea fermentalgiana]|uniref:Uncharacterized protein n=1 Tax=Hondaea fermentalgiana TaxID=2315210 RepID=A0A2R5GVE6_9STRA|nr:Hypothetical Protein FCC1311_085962 [Hondaea fermentalgiana]|eukprot:GBG32371.1 Hypothetical Protein FCC1311_085962 [Hondaea fermentalgiana]